MEAMAADTATELLDIMDTDSTGFVCWPQIKLHVRFLSDTVRTALLRFDTLVQTFYAAICLMWTCCHCLLLFIQLPLLHERQKELLEFIDENGIDHISRLTSFCRNDALNVNDIQTWLLHTVSTDPAFVQLQQEHADEIIRASAFDLLQKFEKTPISVFTRAEIVASVLLLRQFEKEVLKRILTFEPPRPPTPRAPAEEQLSFNATLAADPSALPVDASLAVDVTATTLDVSTPVTSPIGAMPQMVPEQHSPDAATLKLGEHSDIMFDSK
jgi:hypothetical protein